jgi:cytidylate kinase
LRKIVIAIDGPAASGKSTTAKHVAERLGYLHIDTGAMYRAITLRVLEEGIPLDDEKRIRELAERCEIQLVRTPDSLRVYLDGRDVTKEIRTPEVTRAVSTVSSYQAVREVLVREQRRMAAQGGVVLEGRDIGTTVFPQADLKVFMIAGVRERARRRRKELEQLGVQTDEAMLAKEIEERDRLDSTRTASPLQKASDAIELDTSNLTIEQQVELVVKKAEEVIRKTNERND